VIGGQPVSDGILPGVAHISLENLVAATGRPEQAAE